MEKAQQVMITNIIEKPHVTFGFAKIASNGEQAYMGPQIFQHNDLRIGDTVYCDIGENDPRFSDRGCKKRVVFVYDESGPFAHLLPQAAAQPVVQPAPNVVDIPVKPKGLTSQEIFERLREEVGELVAFYSTQELTGLLSHLLNQELDSAEVGRDLQRLHHKGEIAKITLQRSGNSKRASRVAWGPVDKANELFDSWFERQ